MHEGIRGEVDIGRKVLGRAIRAHRRRLGLTQQELADQAGFKKYWVGQVERGDGLPSLDGLHALARALDTTVVALLSSLFPWDDVARPRD